MLPGCLAGVELPLFVASRSPPRSLSRADRLPAHRSVEPPSTAQRQRAVDGGESEMGSGANRNSGTRLQIHRPDRLSPGPYFRPIVESGAATRSYPVESGVTL